MAQPLVIEINKGAESSPVPVMTGAALVWLAIIGAVVYFTRKG